MSDERPAPSPLSKLSAQQRLDRIAAFRAEMDVLTRDGILTLDEAARVRVAAHHEALVADLTRQFDLDRNESEQRMSLGMRVAALIGGVTLSAAVFFFFYRIWGGLSLPIQMVLLTLAPIVALTGVELAARRERTLYVAWLLAIVAAACVWLELSVVGAQFNLSPTPLAFGVWAAFTLLLAYAHGFRLLLGAGLVALVGWVGGTLAALAGVDWTQAAFVRPEPIVAVGLVLMASASCRPNRARAGFEPVFRLAGTASVLLPLLVGASWGEASYFPVSPRRVEALYDVLGFVLPVAAIWLGIRNRWVEVVNPSAGFLVVFLAIKCVEWTWDVLPRYAVFLVLASLALIVLALLRRLRSHMRQV